MSDFLIALAGGGICAAVFSFVQFLISRADKKKDRLARIEKKQLKTEKDSIRTQLLILMKLYPESLKEILDLAEYYFDTLDANFYMTSVFDSWLQEKGISCPGWFSKHHKKEEDGYESD